MTQPVQPSDNGIPPWLRAIISIVETLAFIVAVILQLSGHGGDAIVAALIGASGHAVNHPAGGSPL
jgi:hypothetical protein